MADVEEDRISIVIEARTGDARNEIASLDHALDELARKVGGSVNSAFASLDRMGRSGLSGIADALRQLSDSNGRLDGFAGSMERVAKGLGSLASVDPSQIDASARNVRQLAQGIGSLDGVDASRIDAVASAMGQLPEAMRAVAGDSTNLDTVRQRMDSLSSALDRVAAKGNAIGNLGSGLRNIPKGLEEFKSLSGYESAIDTVADVVDRLQFALSSFDRESRANVSALKNLGEGLRSLSALGTDVETLQSNLTAVVPALGEFVTELNGAVSDDDLARFRELAQAVDQVAQAYSRLQPAQQAVRGAASRGTSAGGSGSRRGTSAMQALVAIGSKAGSVLSRAWGVATSAAQRYLSVVRQVVAAPIDSVRSRIDGVTRSMSRLVSMAASAVFYNALFSGLRAATDGLTTGIQNLYQWALIMGNSFVGTMDSCATSVQYFQNSIGAAASELLDALAPALETVVNYAVAALNAVNQLIAAITGHSVWRRARRAPTQYAEAQSAAADSADDAAKGTDKATKALKAYENTVLGFDELNKLNDVNDTSGSTPSGSKAKSPSGGAAVPDYGSMFEEVPIDDYFKDLANTDDWTKLGEDIAQAINDWEKSIDWDRIDKVAATWSKRVWTAFNGFVRKRDWSSFGYTIARGLNVGLHFIDDVAQNARFDELGAGIAGALNHAVETMDWPALGRVMTDKLKVQLELLHGFMRGANGNDTYAKMNFDVLRDHLNEAIDAAFSNIRWNDAIADVTDFFGQLGLTFLSAGNRALQNLDQVVQGYDWVAWGASIGGYLNQAVATIDWANLGRVLSDLLKVALEGLHGALQTFDWQGLGNGIEAAITNAFNNINWAQAGTDVNNLANHLLEVIEQAIGAINWDDVNSFIIGLNVPQLLIRALDDIARGLGELAVNSLENGTWPLILAWIVGKMAALALKLAPLVAGLGNSGQILTAAAGAGATIGMCLGAAVGTGISFDGIRRQMQEGFSVGSFAQVVGGASLTGASIGAAFGHPIIGAAAGALVGVVEQCVQNGPQINEAFTSAFSTVVGSVADVLGGIITNVGDILSKGMDAFRDFGKWLGEFFTGTTAEAEEAGEDTGQGYADGVSSKGGETKDAGTSLGQSVRDALSGFVSRAGEWGGNLGTNLRNGISGTASRVSSAAQSVGQGISGKLTPVVSAASGWGRDVSSKLGGGISGAKSLVSSAVGIVSSVVKGLSSVGSNAWSWGRDMMSNLANGIWNGIRGVRNAVMYVSNVIASFLHFSEPDVGPLSDFHTYGPDMMRQLAGDIERYAYLVTDSADLVAGNIAGSLSAPAFDARDLRDQAQATIANAVSIGVVGAQPQRQTQQSQRPIELVLRVDGEDLARATYSGLDSLVDRGVITPEFV